MTKKFVAKSLKNLSILSSLGIRLVKITGKSDSAIHPKHLIKNAEAWYISQINPDDNVLDIGCGVGQDALRCAKLSKSVVAFDTSQNDIKIAQKQALKDKIRNAKFIIFDAEKKLPFRNKSFSKILMFDVIEHVSNGEKLIKEAKRVLKDNGKLLLLTDNPETSWKNFQKSAGIFYYADSDHKYEYSKEEIIKLLSDNNFKILSMTPDTYDTPFKPVIDLIGGFSLSLYAKLTKWRNHQVIKNPMETTGFRIIAQVRQS